MINVQKAHKILLEVWNLLVLSAFGSPFYAVAFFLATKQPPRLKHFLYHTGVLPYGDGVYGLVATTLAGVVSLASGSMVFNWLLKHRDKREKEFDDGPKGPVFLFWLVCHLIYFLAYSFWGFRKDGPLITALEDVFVGYVLSALLVSGCFVLMLVLYNILVKIPQLEFKTYGCEYFLIYCTVFWGVFLEKAILGPIFRHS